MKILFVYKNFSTFVENDYNILKKHFDVSTFHYGKDSLLKLPKLVKKSNLVYIWFASKHALIPTGYAKKNNKKLVIVSGGYDVAKVKMPHGYYGLMSSRKTSWMPKYILNRADKILCVSKSNMKQTELVTSNPNIELIYNGVDTKKFDCLVDTEKQNIVITVATLDKTSWYHKGIDLFIQSASKVSTEDVKFFVIGKHSNFSKKQLLTIKNNKLDFTGYLSDEELLDFYCKSKVYCQFSRHESFGVSVAEAMLCNCHPIVTNSYALPEVIGNQGFIVSFSNPNFSEVIEKALDTPLKDYRSRIKEQFSLKQREKQLVEVIKDL